VHEEVVKQINNLLSQLERRTIGDVDSVDERYDDDDADTFESNANHQFYEQDEEEDPWPVTRPTPFTVRPTLPVGQVQLGLG
jgi:hypothetical protein